MVIVINGHSYPNALWSAEKDQAILTFQSDLTLAELEAQFGLSAGTVIEQYDDEETLIGKWYLHNLAEIGYKRNESGSWEVSAIFCVSTISQDKAEELADNIDESDTAIIELAELYAELEATVETIRGYAEAELTKSQTETADMLSGMSALTTRLDELADRVARLENAQ